MVNELFPNVASTVTTILILVVFAAEIVGLYLLKKVKWGKKGFRLDSSFIVLGALILGVIDALVLRALFANTHVDIAWGVNDSLEWIDAVQQLYLQAFEILLVPLILISIVRSMVKAGSGKQTGKNAVVIIATLLITVAISAAIGYAMVALFPIQVDFSKVIPTRKEPTTLISTFKGLIPSNFFSAISSNKALPIVFLSFIIGLSAITVKKYRPEIGEKVETIAEVGYEVVGTIVDFVIYLLPVGTLAIVTVNIATNDWTILATFGWFIVAFLVGSALILLMHLFVLLINGVNPITYLKKGGKTFLLAFTSMSSVAALPLTIQAQKEMGVKDSTANLAASLGTCVGQNACAGIYPAMIAIIVAVGTEGVNPWTLSFFLTVVLMTAIGSIGAAGMGGGNIQASLITLSLIGLDSGLITIFLAVDFFVGLPRPPINASDSMVAGIIAQKFEDRAEKRRLKKAQKKNSAAEQVQVSSNE